MASPVVVHTLPRERSVTAESLLRREVESLAKELPGITFGYLGNFERWGDDRSFYIFLPHPNRIGSYLDMVYLGGFQALPATLTDWSRFEAVARCKYESHRVTVELFSAIGKDAASDAVYVFNHLTLAMARATR